MGLQLMKTIINLGPNNPALYELQQLGWISMF